jgi:O-antigen ligase
MLVCWIAAMPVTRTFIIGSTRVNLAASDVLTPFGIAFLAWLAFRGELKLPSLALCLLMLFAVDASLLMNVGDSLVISGSTGILVEMLKVLMLWLQFYVVVNAVRTEEDFRLALRSWIYTSLVISLVGIAGAMAWQITGIENDYSLTFRAEGTLGDSNLFAAYLAVSLMLGLLLRQIDRTSRNLVTIGGVIQIVGIFFSASRGAMLSLTATVLLLAALSMTWKTRIMGAVVVCVAAVAVIALPGREQLLAATPYTERLATTTVNVNDQAASDRKELWMDAIANFEGAPLFGIGRGNFRLTGDLKRTNTVRVHDTFLGIACETGLLGVLAFALAFFHDALHLIRERFSAARPFPAPTRTLLGALLITMLCGLTISIENFRGLWILIGFLEAYRRLYGAWGPVSHSSREARGA